MRKITKHVFTVSLLVSLVGGAALIAVQTVGLVLGDVKIVEFPTGVFKDFLCISASVSAVSAYLLMHVKGFTMKEGSKDA